MGTFGGGNGEAGLGPCGARVGTQWGTYVLWVTFRCEHLPVCCGQGDCVAQCALAADWILGEKAVHGGVRGMRMSK